MSFVPNSSDEFNPYATARENLAGTVRSAPVEFKHAGLGIASFILGLGCGVVVVILVIVAGAMEVSTPGGIDENSAIAGLLGLAIIGALFGAFVAFILGIAGLFQSQRKKVFAILGTIFSGLTLLLTAGLILLGLSME